MGASAGPTACLSKWQYGIIQIEISSCIWNQIATNLISHLSEYAFCVCWHYYSYFGFSTLVVSDVTRRISTYLEKGSIYIEEPHYTFNSLNNENSYVCWGGSCSCNQFQLSNYSLCQLRLLASPRGGGVNGPQFLLPLRFSYAAQRLLFVLTTRSKTLI